MYFQHSDDIWRDFPELAAGVIHVEGIHRNVDVEPRLVPFHERARERLAASTEGEMPEIQAWRRAFSRMGLKPTQYRCASESLLRRFRKEGSLPRIHPLIDLCNAVSLAYATPIAVFDVSRIHTWLEVRHATGNEEYLTFSDEVETPPEHEVIFADAAGKAHARRWTNRQSGLSAVRDDTASVLIVAEAMHSTATADIEDLTTTLVRDLQATWGAMPEKKLLDKAAPRFDF